MAGAIAVRGVRELNRALKRAGVDTRRELRLEMLKISGLVAGRAREIAEAEGLRDSGALIARIRPGATATAAVVRESAVKKSTKWPAGFRYPAVYEYGKGGARAFLRPARDRSLVEAEELLERMIERVLVKRSLK